MTDTAQANNGKVDDIEDATGAPTDIVRFLSRTDILDLDDRSYEVIEIPEWGPKDGPPAVVRIRGLTGSERDAWEESMLRDNGRGRRTTVWTNARAKLAALCIVDGNGERVFSDRDAIALGMKSAAALQRIWDKCQHLSGLTNEDVDELAKNSGGDLNGSDGGDSVSPTAYP